MGCAIAIINIMFIFKPNTRGRTEFVLWCEETNDYLHMCVSIIYLNYHEKRLKMEKHGWTILFISSSIIEHFNLQQIIIKFSIHIA